MGAVDAIKDSGPTFRSARPGTYKCKPDNGASLVEDPVWKDPEWIVQCQYASFAVPNWGGDPSALLCTSSGTGFTTEFAKKLNIADANENVTADAQRTLSARVGYIDVPKDTLLAGLSGVLGIIALVLLWSMIYNKKEASKKKAD